MKARAKRDTTTPFCALNINAYLRQRSYYTFCSQTRTGEFFNFWIVRIGLKFNIPLTSGSRQKIGDLNLIPYFCPNGKL